jgi:DsbC/DsbD-like thiol-disulfide interchange protein
MVRHVDRRRGVQRVVAAAVLLAGALLLAAGPSADARGKKTYTKVTATATRPDAEGRQVVTVTMDIEKPWHAYANPVENEMLESAKTTVTITSKTKLEEVKITYPPGKAHVDGKETMRIYEGKVSITAQVRRAKGDTGPLNVKVQYMTCDDKQCLPPETVKLTVP